MWFDARAALGKLELQPSTPATSATSATRAPNLQPHVAEVADVAAPQPHNAEKPDTDAFEERAAICEFDGGLSRADAEDLAAKSQGFNNVVALRAAQLILTKGNEND